MDYLKTRELYHHGILGMKWGVRRYQNEDGSLTEAGKARVKNENRDNTYENKKKMAKLESKIAIKQIKQQQAIDRARIKNDRLNVKNDKADIKNDKKAISNKNKANKRRNRLILTLGLAGIVVGHQLGMQLLSDRNDANQRLMNNQRLFINKSFAPKPESTGLVKAAASTILPANVLDAKVRVLN